MPMRKVPFVPPGGFSGFAQQTPATQALLSAGGGTRKRATGTRKTRKRPAKKRPVRRRSTKSRPTRARRSRVKGGKKPAYMVKGSPAAKRRMAQLRKMRRK